MELIRINQREVRILDQPALKQLLGQETAEAAHAPRAPSLPAASLMLAALITPLAAAAQTPLPDPYDYDEATPAPKPAKPARWRNRRAGQPGHRYKIPVYANRPLGKGRTGRHQAGGGGDPRRQARRRPLIRIRDRPAGTQSGARARHTAGAAFFRFHRFFAGMRRGARPAGKKARTACRPPAGFSAGQLVQVLDDLLRSLDDRQRLPALAAGHSGGAQLVQRYAVLNNVDGPLRRDGLALRYVIANPSSYLYLTNERPRPDGKRAPYERGICPTYNQYKYGTDKLPAYARAPGGIPAVRALRGARHLPARRRRQQPRAPAAGQDLRRRSPGLHAAGARHHSQYEFLLASRGGASRSRCTAPATKCAAWATTARTCSARNAAPRPCWAKARADGQGRALRADQAARQVAPARHRPGRPQS